MVTPTNTPLEIASGNSTRMETQDEADQRMVIWQIDQDNIVSQPWARLRIERNTLLTSSDWTQGADSPLTDEVIDDWAIYRQELRDLPDTTDDPADPTWPEVPE